VTDDGKKFESANVVNHQPLTVNRKMSYKEKREFEQLEKEIPELEAERKNLTEKLSGNIPYEEITSVSERLLLISSILEEKEMRWLELSELTT
jgi:ATP-binding cassette subfamily F protein uup